MINEGLNVVGPSNDEYETPGWLFKALDAEFGFTCDAAANVTNAKCPFYISNIDNAPPAPDARIFCNPPYSQIDKFVHVALSTPNLWVLLLPNRTDTGWFHSLIRSARVEMRFFRKRVRFHLNGVEAESPRFGTVIVIVNPT